MSIKSRLNCENDLTITLGKNFDFNNIEEFRGTYDNSELNEKMSSLSDITIKIDFRHTQNMDSAGLGMLIHLKKFWIEKNPDIQLSNTNPLIRKILNITHFDQKFHIT